MASQHAGCPSGGAAAASQHVIKDEPERKELWTQSEKPA